MKTLTIAILGVFTLFIFSELKAEEKKDIIVTGRILDSGSAKPIEYATVAIYNFQDSLMNGTITKTDGSFEVKSPVPEFYIKVNFIGYKTLVVDDFPVINKNVNIGSFSLKSDNQELGEVEIRAEKSQVEFKMDKRVFNVGQDIVSAGGSALDVLNNVPSVDVNIEGTVSLRGNANVQMLINGKPSVLTEGNSLGTITADMIDKIEVVTNPSAKYDAEGTTGIINIVIKKENKKGMNGAVSLNTGYPNNHSVGISLNRRTEKFNLFSQVGIGKRTFIPKNSGQTIDRTNENPSTFFNESDGHKHEQFYNFILGTDYHINTWNLLTLSGHFGYEIEDQDSEIDYRTEEYDGSVSSKSKRVETTEATNPKYEYELSYKKTFEDNKDRSLTASATGSFFGKKSESVFENTAIWGGDVSPNQQVFSDNHRASYSFVTDYVHPLSDKSTLETGLKHNIEDLKNDYELSNLADGLWVNDENFTNVFDYIQNISAAYATYAWEPNKFGIKIGARLEHTDLKTTLQNTNEENNQKYTHIFPSTHVSYKLTKRLSLQAGYSKRISRPGMRDLNPFMSFQDNYNYRTGNPSLNPEYTDAFEITAIQIWDKASFNTSLFYRNTSDVRTSIIDVTDSLTITRPENIGRSENIGLEINGKVEPAKWLVFLLDSYFTGYNRTGTFDSQNYDFNSSAWSGRLTTKLKLSKSIDTEVLLRHRSKRKNIQTTSGAETYADFGIKKKFAKGRAVLHLSVSDVFASRKRVTISDQPNFYRYSEGTRDGRRIILGFSYGFGKGEAMEFGGQKMF